MKTTASHVIVFVLGLMFAINIKSPRTEIKVMDKIVTDVVVKEKIVYRDRVVKKKVFVHIFHTEKGEEKIPLREYTQAEIENIYVYVTRYSQRLTLLAGVGPKRVRVTPVVGGYNADVTMSGVFGVGYQLRLYKQHNVGVQILNNNTGLVSWGLDF